MFSKSIRLYEINYQTPTVDLQLFFTPAHDQRFRVIFISIYKIDKAKDMDNICKKTRM